jgi:hypothetical protein
MSTEERAMKIQRVMGSPKQCDLISESPSTNLMLRNQKLRDIKEDSGR